MEKLVEEAFANVCKPVQLFAFVRFKLSVLEPPSEMGDVPIERDPDDVSEMEEFCN